MAAGPGRPAAGSPTSATPPRWAFSPLDLPDPAERLAAQYRDVGVRHTWIDASGGRSMVEEMPGQLNGYDTARTMVEQGIPGLLGGRARHQRHG